MNPFELLKNTKLIKEQAEKLQRDLETLRAEGSAGGKMVTVVMNGKFEMTAITLDPLCVDNRDIKMLEDLIIAAQRDAVQKMQECIKEHSGSFLQDFNPADLGLA